MGKSDGYFLQMVVIYRKIAEDNANCGLLWVPVFDCFLSFPLKQFLAIDSFTALMFRIVHCLRCI